MQYVFDLILVALFAIAVVRGVIKGFFRSLLDLAKPVLAIIITAVFGAAFAGWLDKTFVNSIVYKMVNGELVKLAEKANGSGEALLNSIPDKFREHLPDATENINGQLDTLVEDWSESISGGISGAISTVVGNILLFLVSFIVISLVVALICKIVELSPFSGFDKLLGAVIGAVGGVVIVIFVGKMLVVLLAAMGKSELIDSSILLKLFD